jgi:hypothetical protein
MRRVYERVEHKACANKLMLVTDKKSAPPTPSSESTLVQRRNPWVSYVVWRLVFFLVPFAVILPLALSTNMDPPLAGLIAAVMASLLGLSLSYLFLSRRREAVAGALAQARANRGKKNADETHEDNVVDGS